MEPIKELRLSNKIRLVAMLAILILGVVTVARKWQNAHAAALKCGVVVKAHHHHCVRSQATAAAAQGRNE